jgi:hypothetical protein
MDLFNKTVNISRKAHFIYFYNDKSKRSSEWDLMRFVAIRSFAYHHPDFEINYYTNLQPTGEYWERAEEYCKLHLVEPETAIFGKDLIHPAHISDVFRIKLLIAEGGVYCDFDTITVKNFIPLLNKNKFLVADLSNRKMTMGNGVIVCPPNSPYLETWLELWKDFRSKGKDKYWDELSVRVHRTLTLNKELEGTFEILPSPTFYPYSHYHTEDLFHSYNPDKISDNTYSVHLYDSQTYKDVNLYTEKEILENPEKSSHTWLMHKYLK